MGTYETQGGETRRLNVLEETLGRDDVAKFFRISVKTLWVWIRDKPDFPKPIKIGRGLIWRKADIEEYIDKKARGE